MKTRSKSAPLIEFLVVVGVLLPISACTWANPFHSRGGGASKADAAEVTSTEKKEKPTVKLNRDEQKIYNRYYTQPGRATGLSDESRAIEEHLGVN